MKSFLRHKLAVFASAAVIGTLTFSAAQAAPLNIKDTPLFISDSAAPLNLLVMGRDHKLYYEAYNDHSDLNDDNELDVGFRPDRITYFGYFDSYKCYSYDAGTRLFSPSSTTADKTCDGTKWSGDWLNYVTMSRIDALRKVLFGGLRSTDSASETILERAFITQDAHSWGKSYEGKNIDKYDINKYTPLGEPEANKSHLFANTTPLGKQSPRLFVALNKQYGNGTPLKVWHWLSIERPVAGENAVTGISATGTEVRTSLGTIGELIVRVKVCDPAVGLEANCRAYRSGATTSFKPVGLLQEYGENESMKFGLLSGSYYKNLDGGVLRKAVGTITDEINPGTGQFTNVSGIIRTLSNLKPTGFAGNYEYNNNCGWVTSGPIATHQCQMWGNPIAEMMYEGLRYFAGKSTATSDFATTAGEGEENGLNLPVVGWNSDTNPYRAGGNPTCAKPFQTVISDINPSYDTDKVPGTAFGTYSGDLTPSLNASTLGNTIWNAEFGSGTTKNVFIGQSGTTPVTGPKASAPTAKSVSSLGDIRGLAPEEPTKLGGYYSASVAYYGRTNDLNAASGSQKMSTFAVALASPLPRIDIPVDGKHITLIPFAKSVVGAGINTTGSFQPTNQIVDFYVDTLTNGYGKFRVNFEDVEQGADHDMDAIVVYEYKVVGGRVDITLTSEYAAGGITQHMGYVISGTTRDGIYLEVADQRGGDSATDVDYALDTPPGKAPDELPSDGVALPYGQAAPNQMRPSSFVTTRSFEPGTTAGAELLKDPLWYAAKYGGFQEDKVNANNLPDKKEEWDTDNDGDPDNYFLVTNALKLGEQLSKAFDAILKRNTASASASVNSGTINEDTRIYQAQFTTGDWSGDIVAYPVIKDDPSTPLVNEAGQIDDPVWDAKSQVPAPGSRKIFTTNTNGSVVPFTWSDLDNTRKGLLGSTVTPPMGITQAEARLNYLRGDRSGELRNGGTMRDRNVNSVLGDFVSSSPAYVGAPRAFYPDLLEGADNRYSTWRLSEDMQERTKMIYAGANDGMLHAFDASTGKELWAFIPSPVFKNLNLLTAPTYQHKFYVDGAPMAVDAFFDDEWRTVLVGGLNNGGQGIYALDVTYPNPDSVDDAGEMLMWEFTDADDADLGYTYSRPTIAKLGDGKWYAIFGNGYNNTVVDGTNYSSTGNAVLYVVELADKTNFHKFDTLVGGSTPNGLSSVSVVDFNDDGKVDYAYAGDLQGNLWKFTFKDANPANWGFSHKAGTPAVPAPLFVAKDDAGIPQPITTRPQVGFGRRGEGLMVLFGTGKFLEPNDRVVALAKPQSFYGLWDKNKGLSTDILSNGRSDLGEQTIDFESNGIRVTSKNDVSSKRGWYMDLLPVGSATSIGEMQVTNSVLRNRRIIFTTQIPNEDPCGFGGTSWIMELDYLSGGRLAESPFDINGDGKFDSNDLISYTQNGTDYKNPPSGIQSENGILSQPAFLTSGNREWMYLSTSNNDDRKDDDDPADDDDCDDGTIKCEENAVPANAYGRQSWRQVR